MTVYDQIRDDIRARADHAEQIASPDAVAAREAEYDRICPSWRQSGSYLIKLGSAYLERNPHYGDWRWDAGNSTHASRFTLDGAALMLKRLSSAGIVDAMVFGHVYGSDPGPNVTAAQIAAGDIAPEPNGFDRASDVVR